MQEELAGVMGRKVDLASRRGIERSSNWIRRKAILESARPLYVADEATLLDILNAARKAVEFCTGLDRAAFAADPKTYFAVLQSIHDDRGSGQTPAGCVP